MVWGSCSLGLRGRPRRSAIISWSALGYVRLFYNAPLTTEILAALPSSNSRGSCQSKYKYLQTHLNHVTDVRIRGRFPPTTTSSSLTESNAHPNYPKFFISNFHPHSVGHREQKRELVYKPRQLLVSIRDEWEVEVTFLIVNSRFSLSAPIDCSSRLGLYNVPASAITSWEDCSSSTSSKSFPVRLQGSFILSLKNTKHNQNTVSCGNSICYLTINLFIIIVLYCFFKRIRYRGAVW